MEEERKEGLGGGIITISVLNIISAILSLFGAVAGILLGETINAEVVKLGGKEVTAGQYAFTAVLALVLLVGIILILCKKAVGLYIYAGYAVVNIISTIIISGFSILNIVFALILPVLMLIFVMKRKYVFGLGSDSGEYYN